MDNKISTITKSLQSCTDVSKLVREYSSTFAKQLVGLSDEEKSSIEDLILCCLDNGNGDVIQTFACPVLEKKRFIEWKKKSKFIDQMIDKVVDRCTNMKDGDKSRFGDFTEKLVDMLQDYQLMKNHVDGMMKMVKLSFNDEIDPEKFAVHLVALKVINKFPWTSYPDHVVQTANDVISCVEKNGPCKDGTVMATNVQIFILQAFYLDRTSIKTHLRVLERISKTFARCVDEDWDCPDEPGKTNMFRAFIVVVMQYFIQGGCQTKVELLKPMYKKVSSLRECGDKEIMQLANQLMSDVAGDITLVGDDVTEMLEAYLEGKMDGLGHKLKDMYVNDPAPFHPFLPRFTSLLETPNDANCSILLMFFTEVAKRNPQEIPDDLTDHVSKLLTHQWYYSLALMFFDAMATSGRKDDVIKMEDKILQCGIKVENACALVAGMLPKLAVDEKKSEKYLQYMSDRCTSNMNSLYVSSFVHNMRIIGSSHLHLLANHKALFQDLMKHNPSVKDVCEAAINVIEGKSIENVFEDVQETKIAVGGLKKDLKDTQENVQQLETRANKTDKNVKSIKKKVNENETNLKELKTTVDETKVKVEEIDHKTLSHAPTWSRDVSKLLNQPSDNDWRLLSRRLGYNDDVTKFATQADPCMSMLDDWFAVRTTKEATVAVMRELKEMNRMDAYVIVEEVVRNAEELVGKDDNDGGDETSIQPVVFLSYQWDKQEEVKLLKRHLEMSGYPCWMDIGQMGGGDKLYQKIDQGMRQVKVVVCCVTEKYAESPNCNKEVNLSLSLNKTMIPLLMDKMQWPPKGGMGPIFGEFLFIRFYKRDSDEVREGTFWPSSMFDQLLFQIRYQVAPLETLITHDSPYKDWWIPKDQPITNSTNQNQGPNQIFISYQWDKQSEIKQLYNMLISRGYTCWLDIMMMGGGVSLYDMIDRGIRGAGLVLSCVTKKYALSANCRREVTLSDAIKKPIIPLLLEKEAWPAEGPMGMILTPLTYIDFSQSDKSPWDGTPNFEILMGRIKEIIPSNQPMKSLNPSTNQKKDKKLPPPMKPMKPSLSNKTMITTNTPPNQNNSLQGQDAKNKSNSGVSIATTKSVSINSGAGYTSSGGSAGGSSGSSSSGSSSSNTKSPIIPTKPLKVKSAFQFKKPDLTSSIMTSSSSSSSASPISSTHSSANKKKPHN